VIDRLVEALASYTLVGNVDPSSVVAGEYEADVDLDDVIAAIDVLGHRSWALSVIFANISRDELAAVLDRLTTEQIRRLQAVNERFLPDVRVRQTQIDEMVRAAEGRQS